MIVTQYKICILCFDQFSLKRDSLTAFLDKHPYIHNWAALLPGQVFFVTDQAVNQISEIVRAQFPNKYFFVSEISPRSSDGWLPKQIWDFINNPVSIKESYNYLAGGLPSNYLSGSLDTEE